MTIAQVLVVILALLAANQPFLTQKLFWVKVPAKGKHLGWHLLELLSGYLLIGLFSAFFESQAHGSVYPQHWEFYAVTLFLYFVFAFPGFTARYLWRERRS